MTDLQGTPSDELPRVLETGATDVRLIFVSMKEREPSGRDQEYIEWHSLDHRPEQYRLAGLRNSLRLVSTPECRAARAASEPRYDAVDHIMTYYFSEQSALAPFKALGSALGAGGRMPLLLPDVECAVYHLNGKTAAGRAVAGSDVVPWRPSLGVYLLIEEGKSSPASLATVPGVAGIWWFDGAIAPKPWSTDNRDLQMSFCYLDGDPVEVARRLSGPLRERWNLGDVVPLLAAPFHTVTPFDWGRYLPR
jgi:hypothetical protein